MIAATDAVGIPIELDGFLTVNLTGFKIAFSIFIVSGSQRVYETAIIHTTVGDIHLQLFPKECPKTVENFCVHSKNGYFNSHIFHRVIKGFMIQTGDPLGKTVLLAPLFVGILTRMLTSIQEPELVVRASGVANSPTSSIHPYATIDLTRSAWPTPAQIPTAVSSSSPSLPQ